MNTQGNSFPFAVLYVHDRVIVGVEHEILDREVESTDDLFDALFKASAKLADEHRATCRVDTGSAYLPGAGGLSKAFLTMNCGPYKGVVLKKRIQDCGWQVGDWIHRSGGAWTNRLGIGLPAFKVHCPILTISPEKAKGRVHE